MELLWQDIEVVTNIGDGFVEFRGKKYNSISTNWEYGATISMEDASQFISRGPNCFSAFYNLLMIYRSVSSDSFVGNYLPDNLYLKFVKDQDQFVLNMQLSNLIGKGVMTPLMFGKIYKNLEVSGGKCESCMKNNYLDALRMKYYDNDIKVFDFGSSDARECKDKFECQCVKEVDKLVKDVTEVSDLSGDVEICEDDHLIMMIINSMLTVHKGKISAEFDVSPDLRKMKGRVYITKEIEEFRKRDLVILVVRNDYEYDGIFYTYSDIGLCVKGIVMRSPFCLRESGISFVDKMTIDDEYLVDTDVVRNYIESFKKDGYAFRTTDRIDKDVVGFISSSYSPGCGKYIDFVTGKMIQYKVFPVMQYMVVSPFSFVSFSRNTKYVDYNGKFLRVLFVRESCFVNYMNNKIRIIVKDKGRIIGSVANEYRFVGLT